MNRLSQNELIGVVAIQSTLDNLKDQHLSLAKAMLILPLAFNKDVRSILKRKNSVVLSAKDLLVTNPSLFITTRSRYEDLTITSLNAIILAQEMGVVERNGNHLTLKKKMFFQGDSEIGNIASDILASGSNLGVIFRENTADLYQIFRIEL